MGFIMNILYIFLFIICLSVLIVIHELGHLWMAKTFGVYCLEFSIGFGPKIFSKKRKNGETYFSLRSIPFGGYVSMYSEEVELPNGQVIDSSRSLNKIKKWKRAIIMVAGVVMNAILALVLFFTSEFFFVQKQVWINTFDIKEGSIAEASGMTNNELLAFYDDTYMDGLKESSLKGEIDNIHIVDNASVITYNDSSTKEVACIMYLASLTDFNHLSLNNYTYFFEKNGDEINWDKQITSYVEIEKVTINLKTYKHIDEDNVEFFPTRTLEVPVEVKDTKYVLSDMGLSFGIHEYRNSFVKSLQLTFEDFGRSSTAIISAFGGLFTSQAARDSMGGIIAVGFETTSVLQNFGVGKFLFLWGMISVNLAIVNLFPFPGLDGWQLLVLVVEAIAHKEISNKVKGIVSFVGIAIVFILMLILVFKDIFTYIL